MNSIAPCDDMFLDSGPAVICGEKETNVGLEGEEGDRMTGLSFIHETSCMFQQAEIFRWMKMLV